MSTKILFSEVQCMRLTVDQIWGNNDIILFMSKKVASPVINSTSDVLDKISIV